jgi:hypothetical protein
MIVVKVRKDGGQKGGTKSRGDLFPDLSLLWRMGGSGAKFYLTLIAVPF